MIERAVLHRDRASGVTHGDGGRRLGADVLDLDAYLDRIRHAGPRKPDAVTLAALHRAHLAAIPFENLDVVLGPRVSVELDRIQDKLVRGRRGGYCYERNLLFAAVLQRLGYPVQRLLARVGDDPVRPRPRTQGR